MKNNAYIKDAFYLTAILTIYMSSCSTPLGKFNKQENKVQNIKMEVDENKEEQIESGRTYVYAADQALSKDPDPSKESQVAKQMTSRGITALGTPKAENVLDSDKMITSLLSSDPDEVKKGQDILSRMDQNLIALQNKNTLLNHQLNEANQKLEETNQKNALMATKYSGLMSKVYWGLGIVLLVGILTFGLKAVQVIAPFAIPASGTTSTLLKLVHGIQKVRENHMRDNPDALKSLDDHLRAHLDKKDRLMINHAKHKLHMV